MTYSLKQMKQVALNFSTHAKFESSRVIEFINNNITLGTSEYKLLLHLIGQANNCNGVCFPSGEYLAEAMGVSRPRVMQIIKKLKEKGVLFVEKIRQGESFHNFYIIPTIEHMENVCLGMLNEVTQKVAESIKNVATGVSEKAAQVVESVQKVMVKVTKMVKKFTHPTKENYKPSYKKKPVRTEMLPAWFDQETIPLLEENQDKKASLEERLAKFKR